MLTRLQKAQADTGLIALQLDAIESAGPRLKQLRREIRRHIILQEDNEEKLRELKEQVSNLEEHIQLDNSVLKRKAAAKGEQAAAAFASDSDI